MYVSIITFRLKRFCLYLAKIYRYRSRARVNNSIQQSIHDTILSIKENIFAV